MSRITPVVLAFGFGAAVALPALAQGLQEEGPFFARLGGLEEVPSVSTDASGSFIADLVDGVLDYNLRYNGISTPVLFAHIHLGQARTNGGVAVFLCDNTGGAPAGTPSCPQRGGEVIDSVSAEDVVGPEGQGIRPTANISAQTGAAEFEELVAALREGATYVNVHSEAFPGGEIRGQIR